MAGSVAELRRKIGALERKYDTQFQDVFDAIRALMSRLRERPGAGSASGRCRQGEV